jgi:DNA-binding NtrC family response regulator
MLKIFDMIDSVADTRATILITGENGTGKSMIARAIHRRSRRQRNPFVEVACGALPDNLLESELFGHVAGAFTGAQQAKVGKFQHADSGTIFLDEIGTASTAMQIKLLRILQEFQFEPVGGVETISVDTRVVLATNENLEKAVAEGRFRQDLFYRINVIHLELPSLRERPADIPLLVEHFLQKTLKDVPKEIEGFTPTAMEAMVTYGWPGNIRELENVVQRAVLLTKSPTIDLDLLPPSLHRHQIILDVLRINSFSRNQTADQLGINRTTLYKKMKRLGIDNIQFQD